MALRISSLFWKADRLDRYVAGAAARHRRLASVVPLGGLTLEDVNKCLHKEKGRVSPAMNDWLPGLVSQGVLLWDGMKLGMKRVLKGHTTITVKGNLLPSQSWSDCSKPEVRI